MRDDSSPKFGFHISLNCKEEPVSLTPRILRGSCVLKSAANENRSGQGPDWKDQESYVLGVISSCNEWVLRDAFSFFPSFSVDEFCGFSFSLFFLSFFPSVNAPELVSRSFCSSQ